MTYYDDFCVQQCNWCSSTFEIIQLQFEFKVAKSNNLVSFFQYKNYISKNCAQEMYQINNVFDVISNQNSMIILKCLITSQ